MDAATHVRPVVAAAVGVAGVIGILATIAGVKALQMLSIAEAFAMQVAPPERVNAVDVEQQRWESRVSSVGSVKAVHGTEVSAEADGVVRSVRFEAGSVVAAGDVLVHLDDEVEQSQLRAAEAAAELARLGLERAGRLIERNAISRADFEQAEATWKQAAAQVDSIRAVIAKKVVRAPFAGKVGIRRVSVGDFLQKGAGIVSLQSVDPVYVEFSVPQRRLAELRKGLVVTATTDAHPGKELRGEITAVEPHVDEATRNIRVQATFANGHGALKPGMFVAVDVALGAPETVHVVPATAVVHSRDGDSVFVIEAADSAAGADSLVLRQQTVRLGERRGDFVVIEEGPRAGASVVATGVFKLREGMAVVIDNTLAPEFVLTPAPGNG
jgi:membrane fusion protein (multidrug efflux system)